MHSESDRMRQSFYEASDRLGIPLDEVLCLILEGKLTVYEVPCASGGHRYVWLDKEPSATQIVSFDAADAGSEEGHASLQVMLLLEALRVASERLTEMSWQMEVKDRQLERNAQQLQDRAEEIERLHRLLLETQEAALWPDIDNGRPWWKRWLGGSRLDQRESVVA